ncbi:MAG: Asp-tRNA(Asn)/Glu-tRNA(Gln) amidotransferase subunit GatC [Phycisphaerae bacterium]|nr:Asp-tRNA(Asn)/Glu-tRNA(Gln) amidotransferase subunit GatC [Tepidisphaeraceae bacterium]
MAEQAPTGATKLVIDDVRHVAKLSRLALDEARLAHLAPQLEAILGYVAKIGEVDVAGVEPMAHATPIGNVLREDVVTPSLPIEKTLQNAPERDGAFFAVPKVIGGDEDSAG